MRVRKPDATISLHELRQQIIRHKEKGRHIVAEIKKLEAHFEKMQEYYEEWEKELNSIQETITAAEKEHGIQAREVEEFDPLDDLLGAN